MQNNYLTYYQLLGIETNASTEDILKAYKEKAKEYHPDKNDGHHTANKLFQYIQEAKEVLIDTQKRLEYDYMAGIIKRPEPTSKVIRVPYPVKQKVNKTDIAAAAIGAAAVGLLVGIFLGGSGKGK
ncbi:MAG: hypothetical protein CVU05_09350 [Bacteroidetes bacterium HGW-Bacteroidetes-21]|jgi:curved DNA-binding protein CbpA|nr:MAG: hypothetical protein CVU05_09350 [Bacteroidetes bacterium HGW-Bacteroidetes-21]